MYLCPQNRELIKTVTTSGPIKTLIHPSKGKRQNTQSSRNCWETTPEAHLPRFKKSELEEDRNAVLVERNVLGVDVEFALSMSLKWFALGKDRFSKLDDVVNRPRRSAKNKQKIKLWQVLEKSTKLYYSSNKDKSRVYVGKLSSSEFL